MSTAADLSAGGGAAAGRDPDADRDADDYGPLSGGKKRKVPQFPHPTGRNEDVEGTRHGEWVRQDPNAAPTFPINNRFARSKAAKAASFRKALFLRRKAALITLYLDAQSAVLAGTAKLGSNKLTLPDVPAFEKLIPSLEELGIGEWAPDKPGWRNNWEEQKNISRPLEQWRTRYDMRRRIKAGRKPIERGGWAPEGSFEFEMSSRASTTLRARTKEQAALQRLVVHLRAVILSSSKLPSSVTSTGPPASIAASSVKQKADNSAELAPTSRPIPPKIEPVGLKEAEFPKTASTDSKESKNASGTNGKKKPKKKKRSVLANQSNPHHVDNYRLSRMVSPQGDPFEPYPHHESLAFPPPMRLLAVRPPSKATSVSGQPNPVRLVRPSEDDFICWFCEYELFFGSENARRRAVRRLRAEVRRKESIKAKAKNVAEGRGNLREDEESFDEDDDECGDDHSHGRCSCGRAIHGAHKMEPHKKPPDRETIKDPPSLPSLSPSLPSSSSFPAVHTPHPQKHETVVEEELD
ncbi:hypothetical protein BCR39DRAFT_591955 [Naematelia encephala]|uniref:Uncharacterized protein n=1 Tax=Naematelia encephala TaxID=71784 RepID=A0A1Y2BL53_9TREE|nr:hypothetical protein BCR39DRAFT_591955 [Naematelia encephala]